MKIVTLLLMMAGVSVAQAQVYKCPGKTEGQYVYQEKPCQGAKADEHTIKIVPSDEKKIAEAQAKLAKDIEAADNEDKKELPAGTKTESNIGRIPPENARPAANTGTANPNPAIMPPPNAVAPSPNSVAPAPAVMPPKPSVTRPAPVLPKPTMPKKSPAPPELVN